MTTQTLIIKLQDGEAYAIPVDDLEQYRIDAEGDEVSGFMWGVAPFPDILAPVDPDVEVLSPRSRDEVSGQIGVHHSGKVGQVAIIDGRL